MPVALIGQALYAIDKGANVLPGRAVGDGCKRLRRKHPSNEGKAAGRLPRHRWDNGAMTAAPTLNTLTITRPDDWHLHVRDGE
ncbi:MAG TPA: hypothetical protein PLE22_06705, partial [Acidovorax sp.]|nr:hypothetical protein [Acidovorax sp.]